MDQEYLIHLMAEFGDSMAKNKISEDRAEDYMKKKFYREVVFKYKFPIVEVSENKNSDVPIEVFNTENGKIKITLKDVRVFQFKGEFYQESVIISESIFKNYSIDKSRNQTKGLFINVKDDLPFYELDYHIWISEQQINNIFDLAGDEFSISANEKIHKIISSGVKLNDYSESIN